MKKQLVQLKSKDLKSLKEKWYIAQGQICPILKKEVPLDNMVVDHLHKLKSEKADITGKGCCRGILEFRVNAMEGKISNNFKRLGLNKEIDLPSFLRNLADYLECNHIEDDVLYIHPTEASKIPRLKKSSYNKLKKLYNARAKFPDYPKSGKLTKQLNNIFIKYNLTPEFYKD